MMNKQLEILSPAGNLEKLKTAFQYGADAVYCGMERFSLRAAADNFTFDELCEGIDLAHKNKKKVYIAANTILHNADLGEFKNMCERAAYAGADALILSDLGALEIASQWKDKLDLHISTQASNTNYFAVNAWHRMGAKRIVLARELSLDEIAEIRRHVPDELEIEMFVHGAMCVSYSGRCLLSNYLVSRDANRGECAQPCRWKYYLTEEKRPGERLEIAENEKGTFLFNSKDLCLIEYIPEIVQAGVNSLKIEGRMKSPYYVAIVTKAYRQAVDRYLADGSRAGEELYQELCKVSHRSYYTGFALGRPEEDGQIYESSSYIREYDIVGVVKSMEDGTAWIEQKNRFFLGDEVEVVPPFGSYYIQKIDWMVNDKGEQIDVAPHARMKVKIPLQQNVPPGTILRKKV